MVKMAIITNNNLDSVKAWEIVRYSVLMRTTARFWIDKIDFVYSRSGALVTGRVKYTAKGSSSGGESVWGASH